MHLVFSGLQFLYFMLGMNSFLIFIENGWLHEAIFGGKISEFDPGKGKSVATSIYPRVNDELTTKKNNTDSTDIEQIK